ncbi:hypothetical protein ACVWYG_003702 [Pedobacter sp. UYEF25]
MGFKNFTAYSAFVKNQDETILRLKEEYQFSKLGQNAVKDIAIKAMNSSNKLSSTTAINKLSSVKGSVSLAQNDCERQRRNCLVIVASTATAAHIACVAADLTVIIGAICHGAAIAYQLAAGDNCNIDAGGCQNNQPTIN